MSLREQEVGVVVSWCHFNSTYEDNVESQELRLKVQSQAFTSKICSVVKTAVMYESQLTLNSTL